MVFGAEGFPYPHPGVEVILAGWLPEQAMLHRLATANFCYLPYWFTPAKRRHAEFSFPTKFTTYLAAGRPVLYHGPAYAGITRTIHQYNLGTLVCSLDLEEVVASLASLLPMPPADRLIPGPPARPFKRNSMPIK